MTTWKCSVSQTELSKMRFKCWILGKRVAMRACLVQVSSDIRESIDESFYVSYMLVYTMGAHECRRKLCHAAASAMLA